MQEWRNLLSWSSVEQNIRQGLGFQRQLGCLTEHPINHRLVVTDLSAAPRRPTAPPSLRKRTGRDERVVPVRRSLGAHARLQLGGQLSH